MSRVGLDQVGFCFVGFGEVRSDWVALHYVPLSHVRVRLGQIRSWVRIG
jgi:hypothetical protein